ncbi:MAG: DUF1801 domain-containing protein [Bacteroidetes bacterium]|nr:DUF1801 domain-containing protein [Bacteroidota bacterium]
MAELKTKKNEASVESFLNAVEDEQKRKDCFTILELMKKITGADPKMWGPSMIGFGDYHYTYASGREGDWFLTGFSPRKQAITLYIMDYVEKHENILADLGKFKHGKGCLYVKRLSDIDMDVLEKLIRESIAKLKTRNQPT